VVLTALPRPGMTRRQTLLCPASIVARSLCSAEGAGPAWGPARGHAHRDPPRPTGAG